MIILINTYLDWLYAIQGFFILLIVLRLKLTEHLLQSS